MRNSLPLLRDISPVPAVGVVCIRGADVLLVKRGTPPRRGEWSIPGGRIEIGETARHAAMRELKEETGVEADIHGLIDVVDAIFEDNESGAVERHYVLIDYVALWQSGEPVAGDDAVDARFFPYGELAKLNIWPETLRVIETGAAFARSHAKA